MAMPEIVASIDDARMESRWDIIHGQIAKLSTTEKKESDLYLLSAELESNVENILGPVKAKGFRVLSSESDRIALEKSTKEYTKLEILEPLSEESYLFYTALAQLYFILGEFDNVVSIFQEIPFLPSFENPSYRYTKVAVLKSNTILASSYDRLGNQRRASSVYDKAAVIFPFHQGQSSEGSEYDRWLRVFYINYSAFCSRQNPESRSSAHDKSLAAVFDKCITVMLKHPSVLTVPSTIRLLNHLALYFNGTVQNQDLLNKLQTVVDTHESSDIQLRKSPSSNQPNDAIENYVEVIMLFWRMSVHLNSEGYVSSAKDRELTKKIVSKLEDALYGTFHSCSILRHYITALCTLGQIQKAKSAFSTYEMYINHAELEKQKGAEPSGHVGDSLDGIVSLYSLIISAENSASTKNPTRLKNLGDKLESFVDSDSEDVDYIVSSRGYLSAANAFWKYYGHSGEEDSRIYKDKALRLYRLAISTNPAEVVNYFRSALALAESQNVLSALETIKCGLLHNEKHLPSWHLLALLLSAQDDFGTAIQAIDNGVNAFVGGEGLDVSLYEFTMKKQLLHIQMTRVALLEALSGVDDALEAIPEVFSWYGRLFPDTYVIDESANGSSNANGTAVSGSVSIKSKHSKSASLKSITLQQGDAPIPTKLNKPKSYELARLLQEIWLWVSGIFRRAEQFGQSEEAIREAEKSAGISATSHAALGFLMAKSKPIHAMEEFQQALDEDKDNLQAIVGMAQLISAHSHTKEVASNASKGHFTYDLFISKEDEIAAQARLTILLRRLVATAPGRNCSEAWWLLSQFFEKSNDMKSSREAMWKCVALEESRAVRDYSNCL